MEQEHKKTCFIYSRASSGLLVEVSKHTKKAHSMTAKVLPSANNSGTNTSRRFTRSTKKKALGRNFVCVFIYFLFFFFFLLFWSFTLRVIGLLFGFVKYLFQAPPALFHFFTRRKTHNWSFLCVALSNRTMIIFCLFKKFSRVKTCEKYTINKIQKHCSVLHNVL